MNRKYLALVLWGLVGATSIAETRAWGAISAGIARDLAQAYVDSVARVARPAPPGARGETPALPGTIQLFPNEPPRQRRLYLGSASTSVNRPAEVEPSWEEMLSRVDPRARIAWLPTESVKDELNFLLETDYPPRLIESLCLPIQDLTLIVAVKEGGAWVRHLILSKAEFTPRFWTIALPHLGISPFSSRAPEYAFILFAQVPGPMVGEMSARVLRTKSSHDPEFQKPTVTSPELRPLRSGRAEYQDNVISLWPACAEAIARQK